MNFIMLLINKNLDSVNLSTYNITIDFFLLLPANFKIKNICFQKKIYL